MPLEGLEHVITQYGVLSTAVASGGGASFVIFKYAIRPAIHSATLFVKRANALFDKVNHELNPNGGDSLVDVVRSNVTHFKTIEKNLDEHTRVVLGRLDSIDDRLAAGDDRMGRLEDQITAGVITIQEGQ